jgi:hypothetical protein
MCAPQVVAYCLAVLEEELNVHFVRKTRQSRLCNTAEISQVFLPYKNTFGQSNNVYKLTLSSTYGRDRVLYKLQSQGQY